MISQRMRAAAVAQSKARGVKLGSPRPLDALTRTNAPRASAGNPRPDRPLRGVG